MKFRYHKSTLSESLETTTEVKNKQELFEMLRDDLKKWNFFFPITDIKCKYYCYDDRIDWQTYLITIKNFGVIGMTDGDINE